MAKTRYVNGLDTQDSPVASRNQKRTQSTTTDAEARRTGSSFLQDNQGAGDSGGRMKQTNYGKDYFNQKILGVDVGEVTDGYSHMGAGTFNPFRQDLDYEKIRKDNQGTTAASFNLLSQFVAKGAVNTIGGVLGGFYSLGSAVVNGDASKMVDNSFLRGVDAMSEGVDDKMSVFTSQADKANGMFGMFSGLETAKSVSDALAFTVGAVASEVIMQSAGNLLTGGAAEAGLAGRTARYTSGMARIFSDANSTGRAINKAGDAIGVGSKLRKIGEDAELVSHFIKNTERTAEGARFLEKAAMAEGMGQDALRKYRDIALAFEKGGSGLRKVLTGSMYEGSLEGRQAYDSMMMNAEVSIDAQLQKEGVLRENIPTEKARRMAIADEKAKGLMFGVMATNIALLSVSNAIQFPTLFGVKSFERLKDLNVNSGMFTKAGVTGAAKEIVSSGWKKGAAKGAKAFIEPGTEFMEETLQGVISKGAQNYHERLTNARSHTGGMEQPVAEYLQGIGEAFSEQYGTKEGLEEGIIGAIVGAIGAPSFKRNSKGKLRPTIQGGIKEHFMGRSAEEATAIKDALDVLNNGSSLSSLKYNYEQSKLNSFSTNEKNKAATNGNKSAYDSINTDEIFQHVSNYLDKGLKDHLVSEKEALLSMSEEEYTKKTRGEETTKENFLTPKEKKEELDDYFGKVDAYTNAYEKVFKDMKMDKMDDNLLNKRLLSHLAYSLSKDKVELENFNKSALSLSKKGLKMSTKELYELAKAHSYLGTFTDAEFQKEVSSMTSDSARSHLNEWKDGSIRFEEEFKDKGLSKAAMRKASNMMAKLEDSEDHETARKELDKIEKMGSEGVKVPIAAMRAREQLMSSDAFKNAKEKLSQESLEKYNADFINKNEDETVKKNRINNLKASKAFQRKQRSEIMEKLAGKHGTVLGSDIEAYRESMKRFKEELSKDDSVPKSFLDKLEEDGYGDVDQILQDLADTVERRETSLSIAANLYGLTGVEKSLRRVAQAELIANYNNNQYYRNILNHFMKQGGIDDSDGEEAIAKNKLEISLATLKESYEQYAKMLLNEDGSVRENEEIESFVNALKKEIDASDSIIAFYELTIEASDAKAEASAKFNEKLAENGTGSIVKKITDEALELSEEEIEEAKRINELMLAHGELINAPKNSIDIYASDENTKRDSNLREAIRKGLVQKNDVVYFRPVVSENNSLKLPKSTIEYMYEKAAKSPTKKEKEEQEALIEKHIAMYEKGRLIFENDSTKIADKDIMDQTRFLQDGVLVFDDSEDAALQFFVMTFVVDKEITNDKMSTNKKFGTKIITKKEGVARVELTSRLYSPYFSFERTKDKANEFVRILNHDISKLAAMEAILESDKELSELDKIDLKRRKDLLAISIKARQLRANDATLYEIRRKILIGMKLHNSSSQKEESYAMQNTISDFGYGPITPHTLDGKHVPGNINNFPLVKTTNEDGSFTANDNFLSNEASAEALFEEDKLFIGLQDGNLRSLKEGTDFLFKLRNTKEETTEPTREVLAENEGESSKKFSTGAIYYMHETKTGISIPVKLFMHDIGNSKLIMDGIRKHLNNAIQSLLDENEGKEDKKFKLYDQSIEIESGDFGGVFDKISDEEYRALSLEDKKKSDEAVKNTPKTIHELLTHFAGTYNNPNEFTEFKYIISKSESLINGKRAGIHFEFGTPEKNMSEMDENAIEDIVKAIGNMRFRLNKSILVNDKKLTNPKEFEMIFSSGLVSHSFETNLNEEKIFSSKMEKTKTIAGIAVESQEAERQVSMTLSPATDDVLNKTNRILEKVYSKTENAKPLKIQFRELFKANSKFFEGGKKQFGPRELKRQILKLTTFRYNALIKEEEKKGGSINEEDRRKLYQAAVEAQIGIFRTELDRLLGIFTRDSQKKIIKTALEFVDDFEKQYKDPANRLLFKGIYMENQESDNYASLNELLFNSDKLNTEIARISSTPKRISSEEMRIPDNFNVTIDSMSKVFESVAAHIAFSEEHAKLSGLRGGGLPVDMLIESSKFNKKTKKFEESSERTVASLYKGKIVSNSVTNGNTKKKIYIDEKSPFMVKKGDKFEKFVPSMLTDGTLEFYNENNASDENKVGQLKSGTIFLNVNGYGGSSFITLFMGKDSIKNSKNTENRTDRFVAGINFIGRDSKMNIIPSDQGKIRTVLDERKMVNTGEEKLLKATSKKQQEDWDDIEGDAFEEMNDAFAEGASIGAQLSKDKGLRGMAGRMADDFDDTDPLDLMDLSAKRDAQNSYNWMLPSRIPNLYDVKSNKYDDKVLVNTLIKDKVKFVNTDFESMSDKELESFIDKEFNSWNEDNDDVGSKHVDAKGLIQEAFKESPSKTREGLIILARTTAIIEKIPAKAKEGVKVESTNLTSEEFAKIAAAMGINVDDDEAVSSMNVSENSSSNNKKSSNKKVDLPASILDKETIVSINDELEFGDDSWGVISGIANTVKENNPGMSKVDVFNRIHSEIKNDGGFPKSEESLAIVLGKIILDKEDQKNADKIAEDYEKVNCKL